MDDEAEPFILLDKTGVKEMSPDSMVIVKDVYGFDMDNKNVLSKIYDRINLLINTDEEISHSMKKISDEIYSLLLDFSNEFECNLSVDESNFNISKLLKMYRLSAETSESGWLDKLLDIITLYADLFPDNVICLFNLKEWLDSEEILILINHIVSQKVRVLLIESVKCAESYSREYKIIIDDDFDEIVIKNQ